MARGKKVGVCPEAVHFQPDAVAAGIRRPPAVVRLALYAVLACIASAVAWASLAEVNKVARARGALATTSNPLVVQPLETGVIRGIHVAPGDVVSKGQVLATLDATFSESDVAELTDRISFSPSPGITAGSGTARRIKRQCFPRERPGGFAPVDPVPGAEGRIRGQCRGQEQRNRAA